MPIHINPKSKFLAVRGSLRQHPRRHNRTRRPRPPKSVTNGDVTSVFTYDNATLAIDTETVTYDIDRAYHYDAIGNRLFAETGATQIPAAPDTNTTGYTLNPLNQYDAITSYGTEGDTEASVVPVFDHDGNMEKGPLAVSLNANCTLVWDGEILVVGWPYSSNTYNMPDGARLRINKPPTQKAANTITALGSGTTLSVKVQLSKVAVSPPATSATNKVHSPAAI